MPVKHKILGFIYIITDTLQVFNAFDDIKMKRDL